LYSCLLASVTAAQAFNNEDELLSHYDAINDTSQGIHAVVFEDLPQNGDPPHQLKYKIRISGTQFHTAQLFPEFTSLPTFFGKDVKMYNKYVTLFPQISVVSNVSFNLTLVEQKEIYIAYLFANYNV